MLSQSWMRIIIKTPHCVGRKCVPVLGYNDGITFHFMNFFLKIKKSNDGPLNISGRETSRF